MAPPAGGTASPTLIRRTSTQSTASVRSRASSREGLDNFTGSPVPPLSRVALQNAGQRDRGNSATNRSSFRSSSVRSNMSSTRGSLFRSSQEIHISPEIKLLFQRSAIRIQASWRGYATRKNFMMTRHAIITIQRAIKRYLTEPRRELSEVEKSERMVRAALVHYRGIRVNKSALDDLFSPRFLEKSGLKGGGKGKHSKKSIIKTIEKQNKWRPRDSPTKIMDLLAPIDLEDTQGMEEAMAKAIAENEEEQENEDDAETSKKALAALEADAKPKKKKKKKVKKQPKYPEPEGPRIDWSGPFGRRKSLDRYLHQQVSEDVEFLHDCAEMPTVKDLITGNVQDLRNSYKYEKQNRRSKSPKRRRPKYENFEDNIAYVEDLVRQQIISNSPAPSARGSPLSQRSRLSSRRPASRSPSPNPGAQEYDQYEDDFHSDSEDEKSRKNERGDEEINATAMEDGEKKLSTSLRMDTKYEIYHSQIFAKPEEEPPDLMKHRIPLKHRRKHDWSKGYRSPYKYQPKNVVLL